MTIEEALKEGSERFREAGIESPDLESQFLMAAISGQARSDVLLRRRERLSDELRLKFQESMLKRVSREPLAYVTGEQPFYGESFRVNSDVLIPRPETELLVEEALRLLNESPAGATVVDVGTGSGAIAILLAKHPRVHNVIGIDVSAPALRVAAENGRKLHDERCQWRQGHLLDPLEDTDEPWLITANLPYVRRSVLPTLEPEVQWEPSAALDGGPDGLTWIRELIAQAPKRLLPGGYLFLEIGWDQGPAVHEIFEASRRWTDIRILKDLAGHPRIAAARKPEEGE